MIVMSRSKKYKMKLNMRRKQQKTDEPRGGNKLRVVFVVLGVRIETGRKCFLAHNDTV